MDLSPVLQLYGHSLVTEFHEKPEKDKRKWYICGKALAKREKRQGRVSPKLFKGYVSRPTTWIVNVKITEMLSANCNLERKNNVNDHDNNLTSFMMCFFVFICLNYFSVHRQTF